MPTHVGRTRVLPLALLRPSTTAAALALALSLSAPAARAQEAEPLPTVAELRAGERVRVTTAASPRPLNLRLHALRGDSLHLLRGANGEGTLIAVPGAEVQRMEVYRRADAELRRNVGAAGTLGALVGAGMFLNWCSGNRDACQSDGEEEQWREPEDRSLTMGAASIIVGALAGGALGYVVTPKRWMPVDLAVTGTSDGGTALRIGTTLPVEVR